MKNKSIWQDINDSKISDKFKDNHVDVLIIGGGITGVTLSYLLKNTKKKIMLIDKSSIGMGITCKTTAKISYLQGIIYQILAKKYSVSVAREYFESQKSAIDLIRNIILKENISCDFISSDSIIFTLEDSGISKIKKEKELLVSFGVSCEDISSSFVKAGIKVSGCYTFHPLKYLNFLKNIISNDVMLYDNVMAYQINNFHDGYIVKTSQGEIYAKEVVVACHYPFFLFPTVIPFKTYIKREYVNAAKISNVKDYNAISIDSKLHSIRFYKDYIIYGSNQQRLTSKIDYQQGYEKSRSDFRKYFQLDPTYTWMNQDVMSNDSLPFIGEIKDHLYIATAYNAWGMTNGVLAASIISDLICHHHNQYASLFNPKRCSVSLLFESFLGSFHYMKVYGQALFQKNNPTYVTIQGITYGIVCGSDNKLHKVKLLCPHMKCPLVFNREEETWDCPCHGSRFDIDGNIICGPATKKN